MLPAPTSAILLRAMMRFPCDCCGCVARFEGAGQVRGSAGNMNCEPDRRLVGVGPIHAVAGAWRDVDPVAGTEPVRDVIALEDQPGTAGHDDHELARVLNEPFARGRR